MKNILSILTLILLSLSTVHAQSQTAITTNNVTLQPDNHRMYVSLAIVLDSVELASNHQLFITPCIEGADGHHADLPSVLVNGRSMQYIYEREGLAPDIAERYPDIVTAVRRNNGKPQSINYSESIDLMAWMQEDNLIFHLAIDSCGCGKFGPDGCFSNPIAQNFRKAPTASRMAGFYTAFVTPPVTEQPVSVHEGRARVQFEVDRTELHAQPYVCKSGQRIDNRSQLQLIEDSIAYALRDENVELAGINICGYASPESPYMHNEYLATNRSRALSEYIGARHNLPKDHCTFGSVPENWDEFRELTLAATDITEQQRRDLLTLIDKTCYGASDYDAKERQLKTDPRFAALYRSKILPVWFPKLRCTKFAISTRLKPVSDEKLAEIIKTQPELLSLNQIFRVARLYEPGTEEFLQTFTTALRFYADDPIANMNAAAAAIDSHEYDRAAELLPKAGDSPEAENARGILAAHNGDLVAARQHFSNAGNLPEALKNKAMLQRNQSAPSPAPSGNGLVKRKK